jgi:hypothetical protein
MRIITLSGTNLIQEIDDIKRAIHSEENVVFLYNGENLSDYIGSIYEGIGSKRLDDMDLYKFKVCYEKTDLELSCSKAGRHNRDIRSMGELLAVLSETDEDQAGSRYRIVVQNNDRRDLAFIVQQLIYIEYPLEKIGSAKLPLRIDFVTPEEFGFSKQAMEENNIQRIVCGHVGAFNNLVKHTEMAHIFKQTEDGLFMISRFWLGETMKNQLLRKLIITKDMAKGMAEHCCVEYRNLCEILPILYEKCK